MSDERRVSAWRINELVKAGRCFDAASEAYYRAQDTPGDYAVFRETESAFEAARDELFGAACDLDMTDLDLIERALRLTTMPTDDVEWERLGRAAYEGRVAWDRAEYPEYYAIVDTLPWRSERARGWDQDVAVAKAVIAAYLARDEGGE